MKARCRRVGATDHGRQQPSRTAISEAQFENKLLKGYIKNWPEA